MSSTSASVVGTGSSEPGASWVEVQVLLHRQTQQQHQRHLRLPPLSLKYLNPSYISCSVAAGGNWVRDCTEPATVALRSATGANADEPILTPSPKVNSLNR